MARNSLPELDLEALASFNVSLLYIDLSFNSVAILKPAAAMQALRHLSLSGNLLTSLEPGQLAGMSSLKTLMLDSNQIATVGRGALEGMAALETLDLRFV